MKKILCCILLALCVLSFPLASAEVMHADEKPVGPYEYTQAIALDNSTVYIPSVFSEYSPDYYVSDDAAITWWTQTDMFHRGDAFYHDPQVVYQDLSAYAEKKTVDNESVAEARWVGEYIAIIETYPVSGGLEGVRTETAEYTVSQIAISNRKTWLRIAIGSENPELVAELTDGILAHIALPEMPAVEYEYTQALELDGFTVFMPSVFTVYSSLGMIYDAAIVGMTKDYESSEGDAYYNDSQFWYQLVSRLAEKASDDNFSYETRWVGEYVALIETQQISRGILNLNCDDQYTLTTIYISNSERWLHIEIYTHTPELTAILTDGILKHLVIAGDRPQ